MAFKTASSAGVDLTPAEDELRKAYMTLLTEVQRLGSAGFVRQRGAASLYNPDPFATLPSLPVLHIQAKGRRVEYGWFRTDRWETQSAKIATALGAQGVKQTHDEVFIAGEALGWHPEKLVELLIHQIIHQFAKESSDTTHHSAGMGKLASYVGYMTVERHPTQGHVVWKDARGDLATVIMNVAKSIDRTAFNVVRKDETVGSGTGRMKQWTCGCSRPKVYTGGVIKATCERCGTPFRYSHKDRWQREIYNHLSRKGLPPDRIAPWRCKHCNQDHSWDSGYPQPCQNKDNA